MTRTQRAMRNLGVVGARATKKLKDGFDRAAKGAKAFAQKLGGLRGAFLSLGAGALSKSLIGQAASFQETQVRLEQLSKEYGEFAEVQKLVRQNAKTFNQSLAESGSNFADVFARLRPLGISLDKIQTTYEGFNAVALASGTSAAAASGAFLQLSQALGSGRLQGDEFRSVSEQVPGILRLVAKEMNVTVGELKNLGSEGKITSDILINALSKGFEENKDKIQALIDQSPAQQFKAFGNAVSGLSTAIGSELLPVVTPMVKQLTEVVKLFDGLPKEVKLISAAVIGIAGALAVALPALAVFIKSVGAVATGIAAIGGAAVIAKGALVALPLLVVAGNLAHFALKAKEAANRQEELNEALKTGNYETSQSLLNKELERQFELQEKLRVAERMGEMGFGNQVGNIKELKKQIGETKTNINLLIDRMQELGKPIAEEPPKVVLDDDTKKNAAEQLKSASERLRISGAELKIMEEQSATDKIRLQFALRKANTEAKYAQLLANALSEEERSNLRAAERNDLEIIRLEKNEAITQALQDQFKMYDDLDTSVLTFTGHTQKLSEEFKSIADTINNEIINGINGMIDGTKTLGDVASSMLRRVANQMLEMAIMGKQGSGGLAGTLFSAIGSIFNPVSSLAGPGGFTSPKVLTSSLDFSSAFSGGFADGGRPPVGKAALVGERGPELFVPKTAGTIIPNNAMGGSTSIVVNVDASGSSVEGQEDEASQLGKMLGAAVQAELIKQKRPGGLLAT